jgi:hypothetical protein
MHPSDVLAAEFETKYAELIRYMARRDPHFALGVTLSDLGRAMEMLPAHYRELIYGALASTVEGWEVVNDEPMPAR